MRNVTSKRREVFRILMTADAVGGVWNYALELCRALQAYRVQVLLAVMGPSPSNVQRSEAASVPNIVLIDRSFKLEWMEDCWGDVVEAGNWLLALEQSWRPDIIHLNGYAHAALPFLAPKLVVAHSCVLSWWRAVYGGRAPATWNDYAASVGKGLSAASVVVAPTRAMLNALTAHYRFGAPTQVIPNGIEPFDCPTAKEEFIVCVGRFKDRAKNLEALEHAADRVNWPIVVIGDSPSEGTHHAYLRKKIIKTGRLGSAQVRQYLKSAAIFVSSALYEPFGLSVLEAALSGCALILSDIPSLRENWDGAAVFVNPRNLCTLISALDVLSHRRDLRVRLAGQARQRALTFGADRCAASYARLYQELLADGLRGSPSPCV